MCHSTSHPFRQQTKRVRAHFVKTTQKTRKKINFSLFNVSEMSREREKDTKNIYICIN